MKKILIIILLIAGVVLIYISYKSSLVEPKINNTKESSPLTDEEELKAKPIPPEIPELYDFTTLEVESKFRPITINLPDTLKIKERTLDLPIIVPGKNLLCDVLLLINKIKKDMFYQISEGSYEFKNVPLNNGLNEVEIFYRIGGKKSVSSICVIVRE